MIKTIFILCIMVTSQILAQDGNIREIDSLRIEQKYQQLLIRDSKEMIPLYTLVEFQNPYDSPFEIEFLNHTNGSLAELNSFAMQNIKSNINKSFAIYRLGQKKYHLGVVSDVLGYVSTAAAAGLAIYHVSKYKKMYGIK